MGKRNKKQKNSKSGNDDCDKKMQQLGTGTEAAVKATQHWIVEDVEEDDVTLNVAGKDSNSDVELENGGDLHILGSDDDDVLDPTKGILDHDLSDDEIEKGKNSIGLLETARAIIPTKRNPMKRKEAAKNVEEFVAVKRRINVGEGGINKFLESVKEAGDTKTVEKVAKLQAVTENEKSVKQKKNKNS